MRVSYFCISHVFKNKTDFFIEALAHSHAKLHTAPKAPGVVLPRRLGDPSTGSGSQLASLLMGLLLTGEVQIHQRLSLVHRMVKLGCISLLPVSAGECSA